MRPGRALALSEQIAQAIESYRAAREHRAGMHGLYCERAVSLADLVLTAYDGWEAEYQRLSPYQRSSLARAWRLHRRSKVLEERGEGPANRPSVSHGREQTMDALRRHGMIDVNGYLTAGGEIAARRAWEDAGAHDLHDPFA